MKKKQSRENELKELLKENPEILMEFLEDWKEASEMDKKKKPRNLTIWQELLNSTAEGGYTLEELEYLEKIT